MASELSISRRTLFRDLNMLEMANVPYYFDEVRGGYCISPHFFLPSVNFTVSEALAILTISRQIRDETSLPLLSECSKAALKLESSLPPPLREHVGSIVDNVTFHLGPTANHDNKNGLFDRLANALGQRQACRITYNSFYEQTILHLEIEPVRLLFIGRAWYLLAYSCEHRQVRTFKVPRIEELAVLDRTYETHYAGDKPFGNAWSMIPEGIEYDVHLRFSAKVAGNVAEVRWHATQRTSVNDDGTMDFFVRVDGLGEILWWILGYGDQVEAIAPQPLRERIGAVVGSMAQMYAQGVRL
ncbi:MAG: WYL domain-containing protein [Phycisphaerae bacterium]|nr:WYL domain-containing protein [Phycisphaerae bacterium]